MEDDFLSPSLSMIQQPICMWNVMQQQDCLHLPWATKYVDSALHGWCQCVEEGRWTGSLSETSSSTIPHCLCLLFVFFQWIHVKMPLFHSPKSKVWDKDHLNTGNACLSLCFSWCHHCYLKDHWGCNLTHHRTLGCHRLYQLVFISCFKCFFKGMLSLKTFFYILIHWMCIWKMPFLF